MSSVYVALKCAPPDPFAVTTTTTATALVATQNSYAARQCVDVQAPSTNTASVFLGRSASLTTANGMELVPGATYRFYQADPADIFSIVAAGTQNLRVLVT